MSKENAKALIAKLAAEREFGERVRAAGRDGFEAEAHLAGCSCTVHDVAAVISEELTEEQLDEISAGGRIEFWKGTLRGPSEPWATPIANVSISAALLYLPWAFGEKKRSGP